VHHDDGTLGLFEVVWSSRAAERGDDLLDIDGDMRRLSVRAGIADPTVVDATVRRQGLVTLTDQVVVDSPDDLVLAVPVDLARAEAIHDHADRFAASYTPNYQLVFHLWDGTFTFGRKKFFGMGPLHLPSSARRSPPRCRAR